MKETMQWLALCVLAVLAACAGIPRPAATGRVSVFLRDAPLLAIAGTERSFSELNVDLVGLEASAVGSQTFNPMPLVNGAPVRVELLSLTSDQAWLAVAELPVGRYDRLRLTVDPTTASLREDTGAIQPLTMHENNPGGVLEFRIDPPLDVETGATQHLVLVDWDAQHSVSFAPDPAPAGTWFLSGAFRTVAVNREAVPVSFRSLTGRVAAVDVSDGVLRVRLFGDSQAVYLVRTNPTGWNPAVLETVTGSALTLADFEAGDFVTVAGALDGNADIDAARVRRLAAR